MTAQIRHDISLWETAWLCQSCVGLEIESTLGIKEMPNHELSEIIKARGANYGTPTENHSRTARLWNAYLDNAHAGGVDLVDASDVCFLNILQKIARCQNQITTDSVMDIQGYAENLLMLKSEEEPCT